MSGETLPPVTPGLIGRFLDRLRSALPTLTEIVVGSPLWGLLMAASALLSLFMRDGVQTFQLTNILLLYFSGAALAFPLILFLARFAALGRGPETRFAAYFVFLMVLTIAATAFLFAMHYRLFYERWHAPFGTLVWAYQFVFTSAGAVYQFVVMGIRLYMPFGFAALAVASLWLAARPHDKRR